MTPKTRAQMKEGRRRWRSSEDVTLEEVLGTRRSDGVEMAHVGLTAVSLKGSSFQKGRASWVLEIGNLWYKLEIHLSEMTIVAARKETEAILSSLDPLGRHLIERWESRTFGRRLPAFKAAVERDRAQRAAKEKKTTKSRAAMVTQPRRT